MGSITVGRLLAVQMMATKINTSIGRLNRAMGTEDGQTQGIKKIMSGGAGGQQLKPLSIGACGTFCITPFY